MKFYANKRTLCSAAAFGLVVSATFTACGDSNSTEVVESNGMEVLAKGEKLPDCGKDNAGDMLYVTDSAAVYYCADGKWATLNGKNGEPGKEGTSTEGTPGTSCTAEAVDNGIKVSCDGKVIGTVKNGEPGTATDGTPGASCKINESEGNGIVKVTCGEGDDEKTVTLYKAMCGSESYEPEEKFCFEGETYDLCGGKSYDLATEYCLTLKDENGEPVSKIEALLIDDRDKNNVQKYKTVTIGTQTWMAENLNYNSNTSEKYNSMCYHEGSEGVTEEEYKKNCATYGRLYTWAAAIDSVALAGKGYTCGNGKACDRLTSDVLAANPIQGVCPSGWHLPSNDEWEVLFKAVDAEYTASSNTVGTKLKSASGWKSNGEDSFGFAVLPAGSGNGDGDFLSLGEFAYFWSSTEDDADNANVWAFGDIYAIVGGFPDSKSYGYSVRCLKD